MPTTNEMWNDIATGRAAFDTPEIKNLVPLINQAYSEGLGIRVTLIKHDKGSEVIGSFGAATTVVAPKDQDDDAERAEYYTKLVEMIDAAGDDDNWVVMIQDQDGVFSDMPEEMLFLILSIVDQSDNLADELADDSSAAPANKLH